MKLIQKFILYYLIIGLVAFGIGGVFTYYIFSGEIAKETNFDLRRNVNYLHSLIEKGVNYKTLIQDRIQIEQLPDLKLAKDSTVFSDTLAYHIYSKAVISQRKINSYRTINDTTYHFSIYETLIEPEDTRSGATLVMSVLFLVLVVFSLILSFFISRWLLKPFNLSLAAMKNFSLQKSQSIELPDSSTDEFRKLNQFIRQMTNKAINDYKNLKEFSENLSHEISTPLAIASGKLELLLQENSLPESQVSGVVSAQEAIQKLSRIQKALSLLTKIENAEFADVTAFNISEYMENLVAGSSEFTAMKQLKVTTNIDRGVMINMDATLAEILFSNLWQNAIKHNFNNGDIQISLHKESFTIENTGDEPDQDPGNYFFRFKKSNQSSGSLGLGLAIVKKICDINGFGISYEHIPATGIHRIRVRF